MPFRLLSHRQVSTFFGSLTMVYQHHSRDIKERAIRVLRNGTLSPEEVAELFGVNIRSLNRWLGNLEEYGDVD